ncbi:hypothetical protein [Parageobacillus galactosidasius]|uniref:Uncharacterized protein n=1 Tax=Parageobacillus galactosidasius TaxID=883812 RepID=A0A226QQD7_9BACL|nr:hypothetical protein [Parageobacillus galactosidasius]OXB94746.1 hypothetical protein B9L23_07740 [Parageobacillus galactosidasius]
MARLQQKIASEGALRAFEKRSYGLIGHVINYHPESYQCDCEEHGPGVKLKDFERHTVDVKVLMGKKEQILKRVPCFVYSQGLISHGLRRNDRVWIEFINGDPSMPVVTAYYREPSQLQLFWNTFKYALSNIFQEFRIGD